MDIDTHNELAAKASIPLGAVVTHAAAPYCYVADVKTNEIDRYRAELR